MRTMALVVAAGVAVGSAAAQEAPEFPKPGPEHKALAKMAGTWDTVMKAQGQEHKGTAKIATELGGLWVTSMLESDMGKEKYYGRGMDTYDAKKKKFVSYWFDSMSTTPMLMEGTYDEKTKKTTMTGDGVGMDGKPAKWRSVSELKDEDNYFFAMYVGDAKE